jgi:hypothetical protein
MTWPDSSTRRTFAWRSISTAMANAREGLMVNEAHADTMVLSASRQVVWFVSAVAFKFVLGGAKTRGPRPYSPETDKNIPRRIGSGRGFFPPPGNRDYVFYWYWYCIFLLMVYRIFVIILVTYRLNLSYVVSHNEIRLFL